MGGGEEGGTRHIQREAMSLHREKKQHSLPLPVKKYQRFPGNARS